VVVFDNAPNFCIQDDGYPSQNAVSKKMTGIACRASEKEDTAAIEPGRVENDEGKRYAALTTFCTRDNTWP